MNTPSFRRKAISTGIALALMSAVPSAFAQPKAVEKPNVIVFFTDDMGWADMSTQGAPYKTENLDKIANSGQRWSQFYVTSPVSSPSRGSLLTGRLGTKTGLYGKEIPVVMEPNQNDFPATETTIATMLKDNGYKTAMFGKWHLGNTEASYPTRHGFEHWYGTIASNDMNFTVGLPRLQQLGAFVQIAKAKEKKDWDTVKKVGAALQKDMALKYEALKNPKDEYWDISVMESNNNNGVYSDKVVERPLNQAMHTQNITARLKDYIKDNKDDPFFAYVPYTQNHAPLFVSPEFEGKSGHGLYADVMMEIDWSVGEIVATLEKYNIDENTLIVFSSDNGPWLQMGDHAGSALPLRNGKNSTFEGGARVPGIFYWPGQIEPKVVNDIGSAMDILPTVAALTGSTLPNTDLDGVDLSATLLEGKPSVRTVMPYYYKGNMQAYRNQEWKVVFYGSDPKNYSGYKLEKPELYNMINDEEEKLDVAEKNPEVLAMMVKEAQEYDASLGEKVTPLFDLR
ncbi:sulfatase-like hydrolase/transferase [Vibrio nomapromontoriensis]|uniref:sulfatase-like hydrolase/transferase n=1 Tax=Vibrio nomapromontoriensis TaxID=2910246 RepID=UPI003D126C21